MKTNNPPKEKIILAAFSIAFLAWSAVFITRTSFIAIDGQRYFCLFDDAMISMRYAWNFSHGEGLVWNTGEFVQGYTNLLMTLVMSIATLLFDKSTASLSIQILGTGLILAIANVNMKIADHIAVETGNFETRPFIRILAFILALTYYPLAYWSLVGMETGLLTILLLSAVLSAFSFKRNSNPVHLFLAAVFLGLAFLTRNDSLIFAILIWGYILGEILSGPRNSRSLFQFSSAVVLYLLFGIGQFWFQYSYYGEILPNTYVLKLTGMSLMDRLANGLGFILPFLIQTGLFLLPVMVNSFLRFQKKKLLLLGLVLSSIGYQVYVGGDPWSYWRIMSPTIPLLGILFIVTVIDSLRSQKVSAALKPRLWKETRPSTQAALIVSMGVLVANSYFLPEALFLERPFYVSANQHNVNIAVALNQVTTPQATTGILWAGAIPYFTERKAIDFLGKSDRYIANLKPDLSGDLSVNGMKSPPGHNKYDLEYSIKLLQPTYVQEFQWGIQDLSMWARAYYVETEYKGVVLHLLKNSPDVLWEKVNQP